MKPETRKEMYYDAILNGGYTPTPTTREEMYLNAIAKKGTSGGSSADLSDYYTKSQTDQRITSKVAEIVSDAPEDFDTLKELSDWINNHEDSAAAMNSAIADNTSAIAEKADKTTTYTKTETDNLLDDKVSKESGKGLSTNDFTDADKNKLDGLENYDDVDMKADIAEIASQAAINKSTLGVSKKNLLQNKGTTTTVNGVVFTVNDDRSITVNGTATSQISYIIGVIPSDLQGKRLTLTGCPSGGNYQTGYALFGIKKSNQNTFIKDVGDGDTTVVPNESCEVYIVVRKGATVSDLTFYPMLRYAEITDDTYEPYKPSVEERLTTLEDIPVITTFLTNTLKYPFNNSEKTVSISGMQSSDYAIIPEIISSTGGGVGRIIIKDKTANNFKIAFTGSATSVQTKLRVLGGHNG